MDRNVKDKILSRGRAKDWQGWQPSDMSLHEVRQKYGATVSDEELLLRIYAGADAVDGFMKADAPKPQVDGKQSLVATDRAAEQEKRDEPYLRQDTRRVPHARQIDVITPFYCYG